MTSKVEVWSVDQLLKAVKADNSSGSPRIQIPHFQRSIVWDDEQKTDLIRSLLKGYPIGSLLLYKEPGEERYLLVDGLQRTTAIIDYSDSPLRYALDEYLPDDKMHELQRALKVPEDDNELFRQAVVAWLKKTEGLSLKHGYETHRLLEDLSDSLSVDNPDDNEPAEVAAELLEAVKQRVDIGDRTIPVIVYDGDRSQLPEIFELLNSKGTELGKYDIYAATWSDQECVIENDEVREAVKERYRFLIEQKNYVIDGIGPGLHLDQFNLFEYLFGLGKVLAKKFPLLIQDGKNSADPNSVAYTITTLAHGLRMSYMPRLPQHLRQYYGLGKDEPIRLTCFERALFDSCEVVQDSLEPYLIKLNSQGRKPISVHTELQMASLIACTIVQLFCSSDWVQRDDYKERAEALRDSIPHHYLYDVILQSWRGSGDTRAFSRVWQDRGQSSEESPEPSDYYLNPPSLDMWNSALETWFTQQLNKEQVERSHIDKTQKVFLSFLYAGRLQNKDLKKESFEVEHLVPVSRVSRYLREHPGAQGWPISAVGNLALFPKPLNREKSEKTIGEYLAERQGDFDPEKYLFCDPWSVPAPGASQDPEAERNRFIEFVKDNFHNMKEALLHDVLGLQRE